MAFTAVSSSFLYSMGMVVKLVCGAVMDKVQALIHIVLYLFFPKPVQCTCCRFSGGNF